MRSATRQVFVQRQCCQIIANKVTLACTLWWNFFTVLDVTLLFVYKQLSSQLGPENVFYINNVIWFVGLDLHHFYFTLALWSHGVPSIKEVPQNIVFYQSKPAHLEPRRPKLENNDTSNVFGIEDKKPKIIVELNSCDKTNSSLDKQPGWKGGKRRRRGGEAKKDEHCEEKRKTRNFVENNFTDIFKKTSASDLPPVSD